MWSDLRYLARYFAFGSFLSQTLKDAYALGLQYQRMQARLFSMKDLKLGQALESRLIIDMGCPVTVISETLWSEMG